MSEPTVTGAWSGLYTYADHLRIPPVRFEAVFEAPASEGSFRGRITDADGIGEAEVTGSVEGRTLRFIKVYGRTVHRKPSPIQYKGTVSEDGLYLSGTWRIHSRLFGLFPFSTEGVWRAQRPDLPEPPIVWPPPPQSE